MANEFFDGMTTANGTTYDVVDQGARALISSLQIALDTITNGDSTKEVIDTFNEIVAFLEDVSDSSTLHGIIAGLNTAIAAKVDKITGKGLSTNDYTDADKTKLAGLFNYDDTALASRVSTLESAGYVTSSTLNGYYTKSEVDNLIPDISGKADKSEMSVSGSGDTVTITLKQGTSATVLTQHQSLSGYVQSSSLAAVATSGSYNDLLNKPTIPTKVSDLNNDSGFITNTDTPLVVVSTTGDVTQALDSGKWYRFGTIDSLTLTLNAVASGYVGTYFGRFTASSNWTDIAVPNGVNAAASNDTIEGGKTYEFSIVDGIIKINEV